MVHIGAVLLRTQLNYEKLQMELEKCHGVLGRARGFLLEFLYAQEIVSLCEVSEEMLLSYRDYVTSRDQLSESQKKTYMNLLEQAVFLHLVESEEVLDSLAQEVISTRALRNKTIGYMLLNDVVTADKITLELREKYMAYLEKTIAPSKVLEYIKSLDILKLEAIKRNEAKNPMVKPKLKFADTRIFLLYYPVFDVAQSFYYVRDKSELVFDFSINCSTKLKQQVFQMLITVLEENKNRHDRRERFIIPLNLLYKYCVKHEVDDLTQLTRRQVEDFRESIIVGAGSKLETYMQIIDNIQKFLFLSSKEVNWNANVWYLERFNFEEGRMNAAREVERINFSSIEIEANRTLLKDYIRYLFGVSAKLSIQTIRCRYYGICKFLEFLDKESIELAVLNASNLEKYTRILNEELWQEETFNKSLQSVEMFLEYLQVKKRIAPLKFPFEYFYKKYYLKHHDRCVRKDIQMELLHKAHTFPEALRYMFIVLWATGLRVNEVCQLKGNACFFDGETAWLNVYQPKMKSEKQIPLTYEVYAMLTDYINEKGISANEFIFKNQRGGAYDAGTFCKYMKKLVEEMNIGYSFRSHDFRHTTSTEIYESPGTDIRSVMEYNGHKEEKMSLQYIDGMSKKLAVANEEYFRKYGGVLANAERKRRNYEQKNLF